MSMSRGAVEPLVPFESQGEMMDGLMDGWMDGLTAKVSSHTPSVRTLVYQNPFVCLRFSGVQASTNKSRHCEFHPLHKNTSNAQHQLPSGSVEIQIDTDKNHTHTKVHLRTLQTSRDLFWFAYLRHPATNSCLRSSGKHEFKRQLIIA